MRVASNRTDLSRSASIPLTGRYVALESKRMVVIQGNDGLYVLRPSSEVRAYKWLVALSQYCFMAPTMEGMTYFQ